MPTDSIVSSASDLKHTACGLLQHGARPHPEYSSNASDHNESPNSKSSSSITNRPLQGQELITSFLIMYHF